MVRREYSALWSVLWPPTPHTNRRHTDEHLSAVCGMTSVLTGEVSRHQWHCSSCFCFFAMKYYLYSSTVPVWWNHRHPHSVVSFCHFLKVGEVVSAVIYMYWHFGNKNKVRSRKRRQVEKARSKLSTSSTTEPLHSLFTCCKMSLAHRRALSPPLQPVFTPNIMVSQHSISQFLLLEEGEEGRMTEFVQFLFPLGPHYIPTFLHMFLIYLWV